VEGINYYGGAQLEPIELHSYYGTSYRAAEVLPNDDDSGTTF
jgi:hypothetical protein